MKEVFHGQKVIKTGGDWSECPICNEESKVLIFVEEIDESFCFACYEKRFGLERLMRKLADIPLDVRSLGFLRRRK